MQGCLGSMLCCTSIRTCVLPDKACAIQHKVGGCLSRICIIIFLIFCAWLHQVNRRVLLCICGEHGDMKYPIHCTLMLPIRQVVAMVSTIFQSCQLAACPLFNTSFLSLLLLFFLPGTLFFLFSSCCFLFFMYESGGVWVCGSCEDA